MKKLSGTLFPVLLCALALCGCGKKQQEFTAPQVQNYTLKDVSEVDFSEFNTGDGTELKTDYDSLNWNPKGNYTYVLNDVRAANAEYFSVLVRIESCDFTKGTAGVTYALTPGEQDAAPVLSNGILRCPMQVIDDENGVRHITVTIDESLSLQFDGTKESFTAKFINDGSVFNLKREG